MIYLYFTRHTLKKNLLLEKVWNDYFNVGNIIVALLVNCYFYLNS